MDDFARISRRTALRAWAGALTAGLALGTARAAQPNWPDLSLIDMQLPGSRRLGRRAITLVPNHAATDSKWPVLLLLHGLGETGNERDGVHAWLERYGLGTSFHRLLNPPVQQGIKRQRFLSDERAAQINSDLSTHRFQGMILVCPYTPNVYRMNTNRALDEYAAWLGDVVLPEVRKRTPASPEPRHAGISGCSLGGFVSYQVFLRRPELFFSCGGVQAAIGNGSARSYAAKFEQVVRAQGLRRFHIETSSGDPYQKANTQLARALQDRGLDATLCVPPGPHNQPWLQEVGTLEMLLWHDRQLRSG
ncbi:MAG: hypothetical protein MUF54_08355 [Polyangiaceae bacterium]|jgi:predicted esterase|nr:hypothetical protein [Polyangiaceae bacterium]